MVYREELMEEILNNMKVLRTTKLDSFLEVKLILDNDVLVCTPFENQIWCSLSILIPACTVHGAYPVVFSLLVVNDGATAKYACVLPRQC